MLRVVLTGDSSEHFHSKRDKKDRNIFLKNVIFHDKRRFHIPFDNRALAMTPSCLPTTGRKGGQNAFATSKRALSTGTKLESATGSTQK